MGIFDRFLGKDGENSESVSPEVAAIFEKIRRFMMDEIIQNSKYPTALQKEMSVGGEVDEIAGAIGEFGRCTQNPIPVNGPIGELVYLSQLVHDGSNVIGHRLVSIGRTDVYEVVTLNGSKWDLLYFDPYHLRKSRRLPKGYRASSINSQPFLLATNYAVPNFPEGIYMAMQECTQRLLGMSLISPQLRDAQYQKFTRPSDHAEAIRALQFQGRTRGSQPLKPSIVVWANRKMEELRSVNEITPETMFVGFMFSLSKFAQDEAQSKGEASSVSEYKNDSALFELGCYMYFRLDLWLFLKHPEHRPRVAGTIVQEFKRLFSQALEIPIPNIEQLLQRRLQKYSELARSDAKPEQYIIYLSDLILRAKGDRKPPLHEPDRRPVTLDFLTDTLIKQKLALWDIHMLPVMINSMEEALAVMR